MGKKKNPKPRRSLLAAGVLHLLLADAPIADAAILLGRVPERGTARLGPGEAVDSPWPVARAAGSVADLRPGRQLADQAVR